MIKGATYLRIEFKRMLYHVRALVIGASLILVFTAGLFAIFFFGIKTDSIPKTSVGVVFDSQNPLGRRLQAMIAEAPEIKDVFDIRFVNEKEGALLLDRGEIETLILVPKDFIESLIRGSNHAVEVRSPLERTGLPTLLIRQLADACGTYILDTEAGIYAVKDWYSRLGSPMPTEKENELNWIYLNTILNRKQVFGTEAVETMDGLPKQVYYLSSMLILWLMLIGLGCRAMAERKSFALGDRIALYGLSYTGQAVRKVFAFEFLYLPVGVTGLSLTLILSIIFMDVPAMLLTAVIPVTLLASACILLVYTVIRRASGAMMFLTLATLAAGYVSGLFYPLGYLPSAFRWIAGLLPTRRMFETFIAAYKNDGYLLQILITCLYALGDFLLVVFLDVRVAKRHRGVVSA